MDPLSVAASVAGLISLTLEVSQTVGTYYKAVKDAPKSIREIEQELTVGLFEVSIAQFRSVRNNESTSMRMLVRKLAMVFIQLIL